MDGAAARIEAQTPQLELGGFSGPLDHLLALARAHQIELGRLSLPAAIDQLSAALAAQTVPLGQKADWVVMAAWLIQLRSRFLLPADIPEAQAEAGQLRRPWVGLQALAGWLDARPQPGRDVFLRGQPDIPDPRANPRPEPDVIAFLWALMALFDDDLPEPGAAERYRPQWLDLHSIADARLRIMRLLAASTDGCALDQLLPGQPEDPDGRTPTVLKRRSAWTSTFAAGLELAKQGDIVLEQTEAFSTITALPAR